MATAAPRARWPLAAIASKPLEFEGARLWRLCLVRASLYRRVGFALRAAGSQAALATPRPPPGSASFFSSYRSSSQRRVRGSFTRGESDHCRQPLELPRWRRDGGGLSGTDPLRGEGGVDATTRRRRLFAAPRRDFRAPD